MHASLTCGKLLIMYGEFAIKRLTRSNLHYVNPHTCKHQAIFKPNCLFHNVEIKVQANFKTKSLYLRKKLVKVLMWSFPFKTEISKSRKGKLLPNKYDLFKIRRYENVCVKYYNYRICVFYSVFLLVWMTIVCFGYELKCPEASQWRFRATSLCPDSSKYYCLNDAAKKLFIGNRTMEGVSENCTKVDVESPGKKIVIRGQFDAAYCDTDRYQPIKYFTNVSGECLFQKSKCSGEGQIIYTNKNPVTDLTCRCDYTKGYTFTIRPKNQCFCVPSVEDCTCYIQPCNRSTIGLSQGS
ncbi:hypothetical protein AM593_05974, partial [Mytilus galloprovincialis]